MGTRPSCGQAEVERQQADWAGHCVCHCQQAGISLNLPLRLKCVCQPWSSQLFAGLLPFRFTGCSVADDPLPSFGPFKVQRQISDCSSRSSRQLMDKSSASAAIGGRRLDGQHLVALPPFEGGHRKNLGRRVWVTAYRKTPFTLSTQKRRSSCQVLNGRYLGGAVAQYCLPRTVRVSQNCPQLSTGLTNQRCPRNSFWLKGWMIDASAAPCCKAARIAGHSDRLAIRTCAVSAGCSPESDRRASHAPRSPLARRPAPCPNAQDRW